MSDVRPRPDHAVCAADFVATMAVLKKWSGLSVRELEKRAAAAGDRLPRSTLTAALARNSLPRQELVEAFVRACGGDEEDAAAWAAARRRIAADHPLPPQRQPERPKPRRRLLVLAAAVFGLVAGVALTRATSRAAAAFPGTG